MARHPERLAVLGRHDEAEILTRIRGMPSVASRPRRPRPAQEASQAGIRDVRRATNAALEAGLSHIIGAIREHGELLGPERFGAQ